MLLQVLIMLLCQPAKSPISTTSQRPSRCVSMHSEKIALHSWKVRREGLVTHTNFSVCAIQQIMWFLANLWHVQNEPILSSFWCLNFAVSYSYSRPQYSAHLHCSMSASDVRYSISRLGLVRRFKEEEEKGPGFSSLNTHLMMSWNSMVSAYMLRPFIQYI